MTEEHKIFKSGGRHMGKTDALIEKMEKLLNKQQSTIEAQEKAYNDYHQAAQRDINKLMDEIIALKSKLEEREREIKILDKALLPMFSNAELTLLLRAVSTVKGYHQPVETFEVYIELQKKISKAITERDHILKKQSKP